MSHNDSFGAAIDLIPFEDHHVHQPYRRKHELSAADFRRPFTEANIPAVWHERLPSHLTYRWLIRELAALLDVAPNEAAVLEARNAMAPAIYHRFLADRANLGASYADDLFAAGECLTLEEWSRLLGRPVYRVLRVEAVVEQGLDAAPCLDDALQGLEQTIVQGLATKTVALKSIAGYRSGLALEPPTGERRRRAEAAYNRTRESALVRGRGRVADKDLVDTIVWTALEIAAPHRLPMQFHVGLGDDDIVLGRNDPALLRALFTHEPFREIPLVLLHCYPYQRQAGYLASLYPNVYVDLGLTVPLVGPGAEQLIAEVLELAPAEQLLASTDGHMTPEFQWFGILVWRWALARLLGKYVDWAILTENEALETAESILRGNAARVYPLATPRRSPSRLPTLPTPLDARRRPRP